MSTNKKFLPKVFGLGEFQRSDQQVRRCKIIGTIGPASSSPEVLRKLAKAGLNIARLNFSHGDHETHRQNIEKIRQISQETNRNISILQDLQGPKIRCGKLLNDQCHLETGKRYTLVYGETQTDPQIIPIDYKYLNQDIQVGDGILMDDGLLHSQVVEINKQGHTIIEMVEGISISVPSLSSASTIIQSPSPSLALEP